MRTQVGGRGFLPVKRLLPCERESGYSGHAEACQPTGAIFTAGRGRWRSRPFPPPDSEELEAASVGQQPI